MRIAADTTRTSEERRDAVFGVAGQLTYLRKLHRMLPRDEHHATRRRLVDAFAWGLVAFMNDRLLYPEPPEPGSPQATALYGAMIELRDYLVELGTELPPRMQLVARAETTHADLPNAAWSAAADLGLRLVAARALREARLEPGRGSSATDTASAVADELEHLHRALVAPAPHRLAWPSAQAVKTVLEPAIDELVRWGSDDRVAMTARWAALFRAENAIRQSTRLPPLDRHLALQATADQVVALLGQRGAPVLPTTSTQAIARIGLRLDELVKARLRAIRNLARKLSEPPPPSEGDAVLTILSLALSMTVAGVGAVVASYVVSGVAAAATRSTAMRAADPFAAPVLRSLDLAGLFGPATQARFEEGLSEAVQALVGGAIPTAQALGWLAPKDAPTPTGAGLSKLTAKLLKQPRDLFVAGVERGLEQADAQSRLRLLEVSSALATLPVEQLQAVEARLASVAARAEDLQLYVAMLEWMNFLARWSFGAIAGTPRGARLGSAYQGIVGTLRVDYLVDRLHPGTAPPALHEARAGVGGDLWRAIQLVGGDGWIERLPLNQVYRFFLGSQYPGADVIRIVVHAPEGASLTLDDYHDQGRRALAACALDLPFSGALDDAIRHGQDARSDEGAALAKRLAAMPLRDLMAARARLVAAARATPIAQVRADG